MTKSNLLTYTYEYSVKNTQANVVKLKILEQAPLSSDEKLKVRERERERGHAVSPFQVTLLTPAITKANIKVPFSHGHCLLNDDHLIEWHCVLPVSQDITIQLTFSVEFPQGLTVEGLPNI